MTTDTASQTITITIVDAGVDGVIARATVNGRTHQTSERDWPGALKDLANDIASANTPWPQRQEAA